MAKEGADVYEAAAATLGAAVGGAAGKKIGSMAGRKRLWPQSGTRGRNAAVADLKENIRSWQREYDSQGGAWRLREINKLKAKLRTATGRNAMIGGAVAGGIGGKSIGSAMNERNRK